MNKKIGLLGGFSHESTAAYYVEIHRKYVEKFGNYYFPEMVVYSLDFQKFTDLENGQDKQAYLDYTMTGIDGLIQAGVDCIAMTANSPHAIFDALAAKTPVPMISIVETVCQNAAVRGFKDLLLLGIRFTMQSDFYAKVGARYGLAIRSPEPGDQDRVEEMIFGELARGIFTDERRADLTDIILRYPCDAAILGCTELPLLMRESACPVPLLDTVDIHTDRILQQALAVDAETVPK